MPVPRIHLFELEDQPWFPRTIRDLATDYLRFMEAQFALHKPVVPLLRAVLEQSGSRHVVDLCSGGGGPILAVYEALGADGILAQVTLTDKYPNLDAFRGLSMLYPSGITYAASPVDATQVPAELRGLRTIFNAFHHFTPESARLVLASALAAQEPIGIFEIPERSLLSILPFLLTPFFVAIATPFIRPFRWSRLFWTYIVPLVPLTCWWDGLVSQLRAYSVEELLELTRGLENYEWKADRVGIAGTPGHLTYLLGTPKTGRPKPPPGPLRPARRAYADRIGPGKRRVWRSKRSAFPLLSLTVQNFQH